MIETALIGCAHIHTPGFIKRLQARDDVKVTAVWDHDGARAQKRAGELDAAVVQDLDAIWSNPAIQAVVICTETDRHEPLVLAAAAAKKHLFVEKPLGMGAADAYRMADAIAEAGVLFQTGYFQRGNPHTLFLKEQIDKGAFGRITRVRHSNCHGGALGDWFTPEWLWMTDLKQAGVGAFGDLGTHSLDILMWLLGDVTSVTATLDTAIDRYPNCDEFGEGLLRFANGVVGSLAAGWVDVADPVKVIVSGTEGHAYVSGNDLFFKSSQVEGADGAGPWRDLPEAWPHAFELFFDAVGGKAGIPLVGAHEAAARSAVMEAMYQAAAQQTWVGIESKS
jgi:predicted dehydrogenase